MTTARILIKKAMQKAGILTKTEEPAADEANDGLDALNAMLSSWSTDSLLIRANVRETFSLVGGTNEYTIGTSQTFNTSLPISIVAAAIRSGTTDYPLKLISDVNYEVGVDDKSASGLPRFLNFDNAYPVGRIRLYLSPSQAYSLRLTSEKILSTLTLDTDVDLGPGWERAIIYNLAPEIAGDYGQEAPVGVTRIAAISLGSIKTQVARAKSMDSRPATGQEGNIYVGYNG